MYLRRRRDKIGSQLFSSEYLESVGFEEISNQLRRVVKIVKILSLSLLSLYHDYSQEKNKWKKLLGRVTSFDRIFGPRDRGDFTWFSTFLCIRASRFFIDSPLLIIDYTIHWMSGIYVRNSLCCVTRIIFYNFPK